MPLSGSPRSSTIACQRLEMADLQRRNRIERRRASDRHRHRSDICAVSPVIVLTRAFRCRCFATANDHMLGPNQRTRPGWYRSDPQRRVAGRRSCFPGVSHPAPASRLEGASHRALQRRPALRIRVSGRHRGTEADPAPSLRRAGERLLSPSSCASMTLHYPSNYRRTTPPAYHRSVASVHPWERTVWGRKSPRQKLRPNCRG